MKKLNFFRVIIALALILIGTLPSFAHDFEVDGIYYNITSDTDKTVEVTYSGTSYNEVTNEYTGVVTIPSYVSYFGTTYSVTSIGDYAFFGCSGLTSITIGNSITSIGGRVFSGCTSLTEVNIYDLSAWCKIDFDSSNANPLHYARHLKLNGTEITNLVIPDDITKIKDYAFDSCIGLTSVTIPNSVTEIGYQTFTGCSGLRSVTIGNSVTSIGRSAFYGCTNLKFVINLSNLTFSDGTTDYGYIAYYAYRVINVPNDGYIDGDFVWADNTSNILVIYLGNATELILPMDLNGENYIIGDYAFFGCSGLKSVTIPNSVTGIGYGAFDGCTGLTSVTIPNSVTDIGNGAFSGCSGLTSIIVENGNWVYDSRDNCNAIIKTESNTLILGCKNTTIPNSVTSIGENAFSGCSGLTSVTIPNSITEIGYGAFSGCTGLTTVNYNATNCTNMGVFSSPVFEGCTNLATLNIGNNVTNIPNYAFYGCSGLTSVTIPNSVTSIGESAFCYCNMTTVNYNAKSCMSMGYHVFYGCTNLKTINIGNSVKTIPSDAFSSCTYLTEVNISDLSAWCKIDFADKYANPLHYAHHLKLNGTEITNLVIPDDITEIKAYAFDGCRGLTSVTIPNSVTSIGDYAFASCLGLTSITIPESVTSIGTSAFSGCSGLTSVTIPNSVTSIGTSAFSGCSGLTSVTIPNSVTSIGTSAFKGCTDLATVYYNAENCTSMGSSSNPVFSGCTNLKTINIGNSVKTIPSDAFYSCTRLAKVNISDLSTWCKIDFADAYANPLHYARHLKLNGTEITNLVIPDDITEIKAFAFNGCSGLTSVTIPNSVTSIGTSAFSSCFGLTSVTIPESVTSIGHGTFDDCNNLLYMTLLGENPPAMPSGFISDRKDFIILVPTGCVDIYKNDPNWSQFTEIYEIYNKYLHFKQTSNGNCYLSSCEVTASGKIEIPKIVIIDGIFCEVTSIGEYAFFNCTDITSVTIPNSVTSIGNYAFNLCTNLVELIIEDGKETLSLGYNFYNFNYYSAGRGLFYDCPLEKIYLGRNLDYNTSVYFGYSPFYNNSKIKEITIGNSVTSIGSDAFKYCINLKLVINLSNLYFIKGTQGFGYIAYYANRVINAHNGYIDGDFIWAEKDSVNTLLAYIGNATEVTIPNSVTTIGYDAFYGCTSLTEVNISDLSAWYKIYFANDYANPLYYAGHLKLNGTEITNLVIPDDIYQIKRYTFVNCTGLTSVTIPNSVTSIGTGAFSGSGLRLIFSYCMTPPTCEDEAFYGCYAARLMVPEGTYYDYLVANEWYKFDKIQEFAGIEGVEVDNNAVEIDRYDIYGRQLTEPTKGINIIKMSDGSTRKEYVK